MRGAALWIPNTLTALRVLLIPVLLGMMDSVSVPQGDWSGARAVTVALVLFLGATDWLDGYLARRLGATSRWGSMADAVADRLALLAPLLYVAIREPAAFPDVPLWIPLWIVALDLLTGVAWVGARWRRGARRPRSHRMAGRVGVWILFALSLWIVAGLSDAGVILLGVVGLGLITASSAIYIVRWFR